MAESVDRGMNQLLKELKYLDEHEIRMGVLSGSVTSDVEGQAAGDVKGDDLKEGPRRGRRLPITQVEVFAIHELGLGVPKRDVIRFVMDRNKAEVQKIAIRVVDLVADGKMTGADALGFMGEKLVQLFQERIFDRIPPPLAPATIDRKTRVDGKKADIPLVLFSQYNRSFRWNLVARRHA